MKAFSSLMLVLVYALLTPAHAETNTVNRPDGGKTVSVVDSRNSPLQTSDYGVDGSLTRKTTYERDDERKLLKMTIQSGDGKIKRTEHYSYDQNGRAVATRKTTADGSTWMRAESYDENGNHAATRIFDPNGREATPKEWDRAE